MGKQILADPSLSIDPSIEGPCMSSQQESLGALSVEHLQTDLKGKSVRGGVLSLTAQGVQFLLQSVATVVLARLLTPVDFGLVAMVSAVTAIASGFADLGLTEATIQRKEISHYQVSMLFWINVAIGLSLTLLTVAMAPVLAWFYREPRLIDITLVVSLTFLIGGLRGQHNALLRRQMRFSSIAIRDVTSTAIAVSVAITLACLGARYWAIVALPLTLNSAQMACSWFMVSWRPGMPRRDVEVRSLVNFGGKVAASYVIFNWISNADNILVGWYWGARSLGLYSRAYNLLMLPLTQINGPASSVAIPAFSRAQDDAERLARYYLRIVNLILWSIGPLFGFLFVAAGPVIVLVLGDKWREAAPVFQFLCISALGQVLLQSALWLFVSRGQSARLLKLMLIISPVMVGSFVIGLPFGIKWVALSLSLVLLSILPWIFKFTFEGTNLTVWRLGEALLCPVSVCLFGVLVATLVLHLFGPERVVSQLLVVGLGFAAAYLLSALIRPVREEIMSFSKLLRELRLTSSSV
jgi:O-antigen/teichoic acid export membrane protein